MASLIIDGDAYTMYYLDQSPVAASIFAQVELEQTRMLQILSLPSTLRAQTAPRSSFDIFRKVVVQTHLFIESSRTLVSKRPLVLTVAMEARTQYTIAREKGL